MSGIFISYAAEDRERAKMLAQALEQRGWPVWWDRKIPLGKSFDTVIEENLARAQCVLVLWTSASVESRWVRAEASEAAARDVLIPILLQPDVKLPLEFKLLQAANLADWNGDAEHPAFQALLSHIESMLKGVPPSAEDSGHSTETAAFAVPVPPAAGPVNRSRIQAGRKALERPKLRHAVLFILLPTMVISATALALMGWRLPTRVQLDLVVDRMSFAVAGDQPVDFPAQPLKFRVLSIENYDQIRFSPERFTLGSSEDPGAAVTSRLGEVTLSGATDAIPVLTIASADRQARAAGRLESIALTPGCEVTLQAANSGGPSLTVRVDGEDLSTNVLPMGTLDLSATGTSMVGGNRRASDANALHMRVTLPPHAPYLAVQGERRPFVVSATLDSTEPISLAVGVRIARAEFLKQGRAGAPETAVVAPGQIGYPDYPGIAAIALRTTDLVGVGDLRDVSLSRLKLDPERGGLELRLEGVAGKIDIVSAGARRDHRLSLFDMLWHGTRTAVLFAILVWGVAVSIGAYRLYREFASPP